MNTEILQILNNDDELYNRVYAYGPGDGINRMMVTVEDAASIATYGLRETTLDVATATSYSDLETQANDYLASVSSPAQDIRLVYHFYAGEETENLTYNGEIVTYNGEPVQWGRFPDAVPLKRGDTIRVASEELGASFTGVVSELDWSVGSVDITMGTPPYNLLDVINGPDEDEEREKIALGLPVPIGLRASRISPGINISVNPYSNSRAIGVEIYASTVTPVASTRGKLLYKGPGTTFDFRNLESGVLYHFKARSYDGTGEVSGFTEEVSEIAGFVDGGTIEEGTLDITPFASGIRPPRNVVNLPVNTSDTSTWELGDLVVYDDGNGPRLYTLVDTTGDPNTDWKLTVNANDLDGQIGETQITDEAISTPKLAANAVSADKIAANTITAGQIAAGAIGADEIAASAITADKIAAGSITLDKVNYDSRNYLPNPGFELTPNGETFGDPPYAWDQSILVGGAGEWVLDSDSYFGSYSASARAVDTGGGVYRTQVIASKRVPVSPGDEIYARVMVKASYASSRPIFFSIRAYRASGTYNGGISSGSFPLTTQWQEISLTGTAPADTAFFTVGFELPSNATQGPKVYLDDFFAAANFDASRNRIIAGTSKVDGTGFTTRDASDTLRVKMGYINGLSGVPSGIDYGFWGALGTGVFIEGAPRVVASGRAYSTDENGVSQRSGTIISSSLTVPTGYRAHFIFSDISYARDTPASGSYFSGVPYGQIVFKDTQLYWDSSSTLVHSLGPGTYPNLRVRNTSFQDPSASPQSTSGYLYHRYSYMILLVED